jgi:hypothetical protein
MAIKAICGSCANPISVRDELGGKLVKCPKCKQPMKIPNKGEKPAAVPAKRPPSSVAAVVPTQPKRHNPLLDLLDEAGVESTPLGPVCDSCAAPMHPTAVICIECGYNMATGRRMETAVLIDGDEDIDAGMTDGEKLLARAEKALDETPLSADGEDFGDGSDSMLVALLAVIGLMVFVGAGVFLVLSMDWILAMTGITPPQISMIMSVVMYVACGAWISFVGFKVSSIQGMSCLLSLGLYCPIFGFMQGKGLLIPSIVMIASVLIGIISYFAAMFLVPTEDAMNLVPALQVFLV